jgi:hypothetical protein
MLTKRLIQLSPVRNVHTFPRLINPRRKASGEGMRFKEIRLVERCLYNTGKYRVEFLLFSLAL